MTGTLSCAHFTRMAVDPHTIQNGRALRTDGRRASGCPLKVGNPQTAGEQGARGGDGRIREPSLSQKRENVVVCILGEPMMRMKSRRSAVRGGRHEVDQVKSTTWFQDSTNFVQGSALFVTLQVVKHGRREHAIK